MTILEQSIKKKIRKFPWGYAESFIIATGLIVTGFLIEYFTKGKAISPLSFPVNIIAGIIFPSTLALLYFTNRRTAFVKWLTSVPAALSSITAFSVLVLAAALIPQTRSETAMLNELALTHITGSVPFFLITFYLTTILGFTILKKILPFRIKNTGSILNHTGLWIILVAASLGAGDMHRLTMNLYKNEAVWYAYDNNNNVHGLPLALKLTDFEFEENKKYISKVKIYTKEGTVTDADIEVNKPAWVKGWKIYQAGYDIGNGNLPEISIVELVKDPWLPGVYTGIFMLMAGMLWLLVEGKRSRQYAVASRQ